MDANERQRLDIAANPANPGHQRLRSRTETPKTWLFWSSMGGLWNVLRLFNCASFDLNLQPPPPSNKARAASFWVWARTTG